MKGIRRAERHMTRGDLKMVTEEVKPGMQESDCKEAALNADRLNKLRSDSGNVEYSDSLTTFFYLLLRDHLPAGIVEKIVHDVIQSEENICFTNGFLAKYADNLATTLKDAKLNILQRNLENAFEQSELDRLLEMREEVERAIKVHEVRFGEDEEQLADLKEKVDQALENASEEELEQAEEILEAGFMEAASDLSKEEVEELKENFEKVIKSDGHLDTESINNEDTKFNDDKKITNSKDKVDEIVEAMESLENIKKIMPIENVKQVVDILKYQMTLEMSDEMKVKVKTREEALKERAETTKEDQEALKTIVEFADALKNDPESRGTIQDVREGRAFPEALGQVFEPEEVEPNLDGCTEVDVPGEDFKVVVEGNKIKGVRDNGIFRRIS